MYYLCYQSEYSPDVSHQQIVEILEKSRINNAARGITGILLVMNDHFVQILEGEQSQVEKAFEKISRDKRHRNIVKLLDGQISERSFPRWSMGFKLLNASDIDDLYQYLDISSKEIKNLSVDANGNELFLSFLKSFY